MIAVSLRERASGSPDDNGVDEIDVREEFTDADLGELLDVERGRLPPQNHLPRPQLDGQVPDPAARPVQNPLLELGAKLRNDHTHTVTPRDRLAQPTARVLGSRRLST